MKTFDQFVTEVSSIAAMSSIAQALSDVKDAKLYDAAMSELGNFQADNKGTVDKIIKLLKKHPDVDVGYAISNLKATRRSLR